ILSSMEFETARPRNELITAEQALAVIRKAHEMAIPSIAWAQALLFSLAVRPKDAIGEWLPLEEPGTSDVTGYGLKWLYGFHWRDADGLILKHRMSKSLRGREAVLDPRAGKLMTYDLRRYPMVMEELAHIQAENRTGPMVIDEGTGIPYRDDSFR